MFENIRLSFKGIWSHKMRSFLTMLGIIIGIAAIIAIVSTIQGTNEQIKENLIGSGDNTVEIALYQGDWTYEMGYEGVPAGVPVISNDVLKQIRDIDHVEDASLYLSRQDYNGVYYLNTALSGGHMSGLTGIILIPATLLSRKGAALRNGILRNTTKSRCLIKLLLTRCFRGKILLAKRLKSRKNPIL